VNKFELEMCVPTRFSFNKGYPKKLSFIVSNQRRTGSCGNTYTAICTDPKDCGLVLFDQNLRIMDRDLGELIYETLPDTPLNFNVLLKKLFDRGIPPIHKMLLAFTLHGEKYELNKVRFKDNDEFQQLFPSCEPVCAWRFEYQNVGNVTEFKAMLFIVRPRNLFLPNFELTAHIERSILSLAPKYMVDFKNVRNCVYLTYELLKNWENQFVTEK